MPNKAPASSTDDGKNAGGPSALVGDEDDEVIPTILSTDLRIVLSTLSSFFLESGVKWYSTSCGPLAKTLGHCLLDVNGSSRCCGRPVPDNALSLS